MKDNVLRFISNVNRNEELGKFLKSIFTKYSKDDINTPSLPVPNQALPDLNGRFGSAALQFKDESFYKLQLIRNIDHSFSTFGSPSKPIEFYCEGYLDNDKDIVITDIVYPSLSQAMKSLDLYYEDIDEALKDPIMLSRLKTSYDKLLSNRQKTRSWHIDTTANMYDFLRDNSVNKEFGSKLVALYGTTKHSVDNVENPTCPTFQEVADGIMPYVPVKSDILSGTICITPKTINGDVLGHKDKDKWLKDGSLECVIFDYTSNENDLLKADKMYNVKKAYHNLDEVLISSSQQPVKDIYKPKYTKENTMEK